SRISAASVPATINANNAKAQIGAVPQPLTKVSAAVATVNTEAVA
ncbi:MAG: hypothetical protein QOC60_1601, partial [Frankiaceae bacterium]|nr:hypothetical protein [Frankiaceae bacterium]